MPLDKFDLSSYIIIRKFDKSNLRPLARKENNMKKSYTVHKCLDPMAVRGLCIQQHWYTRGTTLEYERMLHSLLDEHHMSRDNVTDQDIIDLAQDIAEHSDLDDLEPETDAVSCIAFKLARLVTTIFEAV